MAVRQEQSVVDEGLRIHRRGETEDHKPITLLRAAIGSM